MATALLELLKDASLIKFFAIVGSIFFLFGVTGRVWGIKEPIPGFAKFLLFLVGALMLTGAAVGFVDNKNQYFSNKQNDGQQLLEPKPNNNGNNQNVNGKKNNTIGNTTGTGNQNVQGNNNNLNSNNKTTTINSSYKDGDYTVYFTINTVNGDTVKIRKVKDKTNADEESDEDTNVCPLNNKTYYMMTMRPHYFLKFYDRSGNVYKFVAYINAYNYNGTATISGKSISFESGNSVIGEASLSNNCKILTGHLDDHTLNFTL